MRAKRYESVVFPEKSVIDTGYKGCYKALYWPEHPHANKRGYVLEHIAIAVKALGRPLPEGAEVHHVNEDKRDNRPENLVICPSKEYHANLHANAKALAECGHAKWRKCSICKQYDDTKNLHRHQRHYRHYECELEYNRTRTRKANVQSV